MSPAPPRLSQATLARVPAGIDTPGYMRGPGRIGVVHFGPGAFHRAHQAHFFDRMLARGQAVGVCAVSLRSDDVRAALEPQDGLYALVERSSQPKVRVIGALMQLLTARRSPQAVMARLADPAVRAVTMTVSEKGYCQTSGGDLDLDHPDVRHDLGRPQWPLTLTGWLVEGLAMRRAAGLTPFVSVSCDNLSGNGERLGRAVVQFARASGRPDLAAWIAGEARFPSTMVDSITPATTDALRAEAEAAFGLVDAWPIQREGFCQWVVEDELGALGPGFAAAGVTLTRDVSVYERAKLRLLNGAHSTLAYLGLHLGYRTVGEAMGDAALAALIEAIMREDIAPLLAPAAGLDLAAYIGDILARFRNPDIAYPLLQIAGDGSQKLPFRLVASVEEALARGRPIARLVLGLAAWMQFVRREAQAGRPINDPLAARLEALGRACTGDAEADVDRFLGLTSMFPTALAADPQLRAALASGYDGLGKARHPGVRTM